MILNDLCELYDLKRKSDPSAMPERYWCSQKVFFEITLNPLGVITGCVSYASDSGNRYRELVVPMAYVGRSGQKPDSGFLCDDAQHVFGIGPNKYRAELRQKHADLHRKVLTGLSDAGAAAYLRMLDRYPAGELPLICAEGLQGDVKSLIVFRLEGDRMLLHDRMPIRAAWTEYERIAEELKPGALCPVFGELLPAASEYPQITGLPDAQTAGAALISSKENAFQSYGRQRAASLLSARAAHESGTALRYVLKDNDHHARMGNDHIAFWTDATSPKIDEDLAFLIDPDSIGWSEDKNVREAVQQALIDIRAGKRMDDIPEDTTYHLLGIAPYQARLAVRFYETGSMGRLQENVAQYLRDTEMDGVKPCSIRALLLQTAAQADSKRLPTTLVTSCMRAYVRGTAFPPALMQKVIGRMRADHGSYKSWDMGRRAALLKACLIRSARARSAERGEEMERRLTVGLNCENDNQGYLLGRLFALLEKAQQDAVHGANATIRDRFMGAAATTPARVFPQLLKLAQHHISKSDYGSLMDRRIQEVMGRMGDSGFPKTLSFDDQGMFYIGYYQQKQALYTKSDEPAAEGKED